MFVHRKFVQFLTHPTTYYLFHIVVLLKPAPLVVMRLIRRVGQAIGFLAEIE